MKLQLLIPCQFPNIVQGHYFCVDKKVKLSVDEGEESWGAQSECTFWREGHLILGHSAGYTVAEEQLTVGVLLQQELQSN